MNRLLHCSRSTGGIRGRRKGETMKACQRCKLNFPDDVRGVLSVRLGALGRPGPAHRDRPSRGATSIEAAIGEGGMATVYSGAPQARRPPVRREDHERGAREERSDPRALPARGQGRAEARAPEHHRDLRPGRASRRQPVPRDGAARGRDARRRRRARQGAARAHAADRDSDRARARARPRSRGDPPRSQARERVSRASTTTAATR